MSVSKCYTTFLERSDHKAVVASMEPSCVTREGVTGRFDCPTTFRSDEDIVRQLSAALRQV